MVPRRSFSPARMADFMSSVIRSLRVEVVILACWLRNRGAQSTDRRSIEPSNQKLRTRGADVKSRVLRFWWRFTAAAFLRLRSCVGFS